LRTDCALRLYFSRLTLLSFGAKMKFSAGLLFRIVSQKSAIINLEFLPNSRYGNCASGRILCKTEKSPCFLVRREVLCTSACKDGEIVDKCPPAANSRVLCRIHTKSGIFSNFFARVEFLFTGTSTRAILHEVGHSFWGNGESTLRGMLTRRRRQSGTAHHGCQASS